MTTDPLPNYYSLESLTSEERLESEFESQCGTTLTSFHVDYKGRIFVRDEGDDRTVVLNEAKDAPVVLRKIIALCTEHLMWLDEAHGVQNAGGSE